MSFSLEDFNVWFHKWIVPYPHDRKPITPWNFWILFTAFFPLLTVAYLARRPNTWILRILVFPLVLVATTQVFFAYCFPPTGATFNFALGLLGIYSVGKAIEFAFSPSGRLKVGEKVLGEESRSAIEREHDVHKKHTPWGMFSGLRDAIELLCAVRGIGWDFGSGTGIYVPPLGRPTERDPWIRETLKSIVLSFLALDFLESFLKLWPGVGSPTGGSIFFPTLPPVQRYILSTALHTCTGFAFVAGFTMCYDLLALGAVILVNHTPSSWPPGWDAPWLSTSLHELWARRWHQFLRQTFLVFGGYPLALLGFGRVGLVLGSFTASGAFHDLGMYFMGNGLDSRVFFFFFTQGILVICEHAFRKVTGRRVGGWPGRVWVYFSIFVLGQPLVDSWHNRGLAGGLIIPPPISPARQIYFPLIKSAYLRYAGIA